MSMHNASITWVYSQNFIHKKASSCATCICICLYLWYMCLYQCYVPVNLCHIFVYRGYIIYIHTTLHIYIHVYTFSSLSMLLRTATHPHIMLINSLAHINIHALTHMFVAFLSLWPSYVSRRLSVKCRGCSLGRQPPQWAQQGMGRGDVCVKTIIYIYIYIYIYI